MICENIFIDGCLICSTVLLSLENFYYFQSDILVKFICETLLECFSLFLQYIIDSKCFMDIILNTNNCD